MCKTFKFDLITFSRKKILQPKVEERDEAMQTKIQKMLPKTADAVGNGGVYAQSVKCGKRNCKCSRGELHRGLYYFFTRINGKLIKTYVRKSQVKELSELVSQAMRDRKHIRQASKESTELLRELRAALRERQSLINSLKGSLKLCP